jgi:hypothetical protein
MSDLAPNQARSGINELSTGSAAGGWTIDLSARWLLAALSLGAAALHFRYSPSHLDEYWLYGVFFVVLAALQLLWAVGVVATPWRWLLVAGVATNAAVIVVWALSRTVGVWVGPNATVSEAATYPDIVSTALEAVIVLGCLVLLFRPAVVDRRISHRWITSVAVGGGTVLVAGLAGYGFSPQYLAAHADHAGHTGHGQVVEVADGKARIVTTGAVVPPKPYNPAKIIDLSGVPGVTPEEQTRAEDLVALTVARLPKKWADPAAAVAAGYVSIGDGITGFEHYINWAYINDGRILNPDYAESLVYRVTGDTETLVAAMYMLPPGSTLDSVPDIGGPLTQWHIHDNLCFTNNPVAPRVVGLTDSNGNCQPPFVKLQSVPMIHVWIVPNPCGPFAALEGVGAGQIKPGQQRLCDQLHSNTL